MVPWCKDGIKLSYNPREMKRYKSPTKVTGFRGTNMTERLTKYITQKAITGIEVTKCTKRFMQKVVVGIFIM